MTVTFHHKNDPLAPVATEEPDLKAHDPLTGSWNSRFLQLAMRARLELAKHLGHSVIVAYADLDGFRAFNDLWGHNAGDAALQLVTERLQGLRHNGLLVDVARLGRDEYVVVADLYPDATESVGDLGRSIMTALQAPFSIDGNSHRLSISVGLTESGTQSTPDSMLLEARLSLQNSRRRHESVARVYDRTSGPTAEYVRALPAALASGEIRCAFQPTIDTRTGDIVHLEALARWTRPSGEVVGPNVFVPCAESYGLAPDLTRAVLRSVRALLAEPETPAGLRVWINVSACELDLEDFSTSLLAVIREMEIAPDRLGVEITETSAVRDPLRLARDIATLQKHDVVVAIDDFGSGYSPLGYLRALAPDIVKLDRTLISGIEVDVVNQQLVHGIVNVLRELDIEIVAEGVERVEEQQWLSNTGIHNVQGFLWSRPVDPSSLDLARSFSEHRLMG